MKKITGFNVAFRPLKDSCGIPITTEIDKDAFQMRSDGIILKGKLYFWETIFSVKVIPIFCEHNGEHKNNICLECGEET